MSQNFSTLAWAASSAADAPRIKTRTPGPESRALHDRMARHGVFGGTVRLHPVAFESGLGVILTDVEDNTYLDFTSGGAVANLGHSHPKIAEAIVSAPRVPANVRDQATGHKTRVLEALASVTPPGLTAFNLFSCGTEAMEGAMRVAREVTGRQGFVSLHDDFHGRSSNAADVSAGRTSNARRSPASLIVPGLDIVEESIAVAEEQYGA